MSEPDFSNLLQRILQFFDAKLAAGIKGPFSRELVAAGLLDDENVVARILGMAFRQQALYRHTPGLGTKKEGTKVYWHLNDSSVTLAKDPWPEIVPRNEAIKNNAEARAARTTVDQSNPSIKKSGWREEAESPSVPAELKALDLINLGVNLNSDGELTLTWDGGGRKFKRKDSETIYEYLKLFNEFPAHTVVSQ